MSTKSYFVTLLVLSALLGISLAGNAEQWRHRSIYQVLTDRFAHPSGTGQACSNLRDYCGGTFKTIQKNLDYITAMGFDALWLSPVQVNSDNGYHGYWPTDFYSINPKFGTEQDLKDLVNACHSKGIWVMIDVVANHVGWNGENFKAITPFNDASHYHSRCQIDDWNDQWKVENCRLADLPDLDQGNPWVKSTLNNWIRDFVKKYNFDGIRIDTVPEVQANFWNDFTNAAGVFAIGECSNTNYGYVGQYQKNIQGLVNYNFYYAMQNMFGSRHTMNEWKNHFNLINQAFSNPDLLGNFIDNHDTPRFLSNFGNDQRPFRSALAFAMTTRGIPIVYYGTEQSMNGGQEPECRADLWRTGSKWTEVSQFIKIVNSYRKSTQWYMKDFTERYVDDTFYAFSRGDSFFAFTNKRDEQEMRTITYHPYSEGQTLCNIFHPTDCVKVEGNKFPIYLNNGETKIFVPKNSLISGLSLQAQKGFLE